MKLQYLGFIPLIILIISILGSDENYYGEYSWSWANVVGRLIALFVIFLILFLLIGGFIWAISGAKL